MPRRRRGREPARPTWLLGPCGGVPRFFDARPAVVLAPIQLGPNNQVHKPGAFFAVKDAYQLCDTSILLRFFIII